MNDQTLFWEEGHIASTRRPNCLRVLLSNTKISWDLKPKDKL